MMDDTTKQQPGSKTSEAAGSWTAFCQECGRPLTADSLRRVGAGIFCEPCAQGSRPGGAWQEVPHGAATNARPGQPPVWPTPNSPNPVLAGLLGFIPGVGAMYNAQFVKGAMHLIVFVVLVALADNANWVFWWLVWGWIFYQVFEAYHTARARRDQLPLPNPFGWNDLGDRFGFARPGPQPPRPGSPVSVNAPSAAAHTGANWAGYIPPRPTTSTPYSPFTEHRTDNPYTAPFTEPAPKPVAPISPVVPTIPYTPIYTGSVPYRGASTPTVVGGSRRFPAGAVWLIGLGLLFLLGNLLPALRFSGPWFAPLLLAGLAFWSALRRLSMLQTRNPSNDHGSLTCALTGPVVLFTVAVLLATQAAHILPMRRGWPVILVVWGLMLLLQRRSGRVTASVQQNGPEPMSQAVRSTSGTGSLGL